MAVIALISATFLACSVRFANGFEGCLMSEPKIPITRSIVHCAERGSKSVRLRTKMDKGMNALTNKMKTLGLPLIVEVLEFENPFKEILVCEFKLLRSNSTLVDDSNGDDELAVVLVVQLWQYPIE